MLLPLVTVLASCRLVVHESKIYLFKADFITVLRESQNFNKIL